MSLTKLSLAGKYFNYSRPGRVWSVTSRLGTGNLLTFFYSVAPSPSPPPPKLNRRHTGRLRMRDNLLTGEARGGDGGSGKEPNHTTVLYNTFNNLYWCPNTPTMALITLKIAPNPLRRRPYRRLKTMIKTTKNFSYFCITWLRAA